MFRTIINWRLAAIALALVCALGALLISASQPVGAERLQATALYPNTLTNIAGSASNQPLSVLSVQDQSGNDDTWENYIEFDPAARYIGVFYYQLPTGTTGADLATLALDTNYKGPANSEQNWIWAVYNFCGNKWSLVGDNTGAPNWTWQSFSFTVPNPTCHADANGVMATAYATFSRNDVSDLDYLALSYTTSGTTPTPTPTVTPTPPAGSWWQPAPGTSWQWQLQGTIDTSFDVDMYDIDLFDTPQATINQLKADGRVVICYMSAGSYEEWRPDAAAFPAAVLGDPLDEWPGERWLDISRIDLLGPIMTARFDLAVSKGCDGIEPDNIDGYANGNGVGLTYQDQIDYNTWLAAEAHARGLSIGLKNDLDQIAELLPHYDWAINEQCHQYNECDLLLPFVAAGKAVFGVEYAGSLNSFCPEANANDFDWLRKRLALGAWRQSCR